MPKFTKEIIRPGKYVAKTFKGNRVDFDVTPDRILRWVTTFREMRKDGLKVPAPWRHDPESKPLSSETKDSSNNAGYWEDLWVGHDGSLYGTLDVPSRTDAEKVGKSVQEVSTFVRPEWKDGVGRDWTDSIQHIALVQHPVVPGQENFKEVADSLGVAASLSDVLLDDETGNKEGQEVGSKSSDLTPSNATSPSIQDVVASLKSVNLVLPDDTTVENLAERIVVAARALAGNKEGEDSEGSDPKEQPTPIALSLQEVEKMTESELKAIAKKALEGTEKANEIAKQAVEFASSQVVQGFEVRIKDLITSGRVTPKYVKAELFPMVEAYELSLGEDGKPKKTELDGILNALEQVTGESLIKSKTGVGKGTSLKPGQGILGAHEEFLPDEGEQEEMSDEDVDKHAKEQMKAGGLKSHPV